MCGFLPAPAAAPKWHAGLQQVPPSTPLPVTRCPALCTMRSASCCPPWRRGACGACTWRGRSTAPLGTRRRRRRAWWPEPMRPAQVRWARPLGAGIARQPSCRHRCWEGVDFAAGTLGSVRLPSSSIRRPLLPPSPHMPSSPVSADPLVPLPPCTRSRPTAAVPRGGLHGRASGRLACARHERAIPHAVGARRVPPGAAPRQRRPAHDAAGPRGGLLLLLCLCCALLCALLCLACEPGFFSLAWLPDGYRPAPDAAEHAGEELGCCLRHACVQAACAGERLPPSNLPHALPCQPVQLGLVGEERAASFRQRRREVEDAEQLLDSIRLSSSGWARQGFQVRPASVSFVACVAAKTLPCKVGGCCCVWCCR